MAKDLTWIKAIEKVLSESSGALHYKEIAERIVAGGLRKNIGATPSATVSANLARSLAEGEKSPFEKVGRGEYILKSRIGSNVSVGDAGSDRGDEYDVVTSFGVFWRRDLVGWKRNPRILGVQQLGAKEVNFSKQIGIYLLYDGREVIYVGRSVDRPLGLRLYEHTADRLATRWDRFSWFGMLPVSDQGVLGNIEGKYDYRNVISALEAILIEALEPRQNRKRGDDLSAVEYLQKEDPDIEDRRKRALTEEIIGHLPFMRR